MEKLLKRWWAGGTSELQFDLPGRGDATPSA
jgi:hypothetical protein